MAESPVTYLLEGLFPNLFRYLTGRPRCTAKEPPQITSPTGAQTVAFSHDGSAEEQKNTKESSIEAAVEKASPAEQRVARQFISPHPSVDFEEVPVICGIESACVVAEDVVDQEAASTSLEPSEDDTEPLSSEGNIGKPAQATPMSQRARKVEAKSSSDRGRVDTSTDTKRLELSAELDFDSRKRLNRHSLPTFPLSHSRNVSTSSDETLVWSSNDPSSTPSPVTSPFGRVLQDAAKEIIRQKQADKVHELEEVIEGLQSSLAERTERAEELEADLKLCEGHRELNLNTALRLYQDPGALVLVEHRNMIDQIGQLKSEVLDRDSQIQFRDQLIEALRLDLSLYANQEQWVFLRQSYFALQQQYGRMPEDFRQLELKYQDLEDRHIEVINNFKRLEGDHTELKALHDQIEHERHLLEVDAKDIKQSLAETEARMWALEVNRDQVMEQKAKSERKARANEQFLAGLAARMFKRTIFMARVLEQMDVDPIDDEQATLCQLAYEHLGLDAAEVSRSFQETGTIGELEVEEARDESGTPETQAGHTSSSMSASRSKIHETTVHLTGANETPKLAAADGIDVPESPASFEARRRREIAAAEEKILGPLGLGFEDGSPTLKTKPIPASSKPSKTLKMIDQFPMSPDTPNKTLGGFFKSGPDVLDQVTPIRTGGTRGIARDQWKIAGDDLQEFTEVFRGPRVQPVDIVSPDFRMKGPAAGRRLEEEKFSQDPGKSELLVTNEDSVYDKGLVEERRVSSDLKIAEDSTELTADDGEADGSKDERGDEDNADSSAAILKEFTVPQGHEDGFDGDIKTRNQIFTNGSIQADGKSSNIWKETSFGVGKQEGSFSEYQDPSTAPPTTTLTTESIVNFAKSKAVQTPLEEGSPVFQDLIVANEAASEERNAVPSLPKEAFHAPQFQDFNFGSSGGGVPFSFTGSQDLSLALPEPTPEPASTGLFNFHSESSAQPPTKGSPPRQFTQDFNFSDNNSAVPFTATSKTPSPPPSAIHRTPIAP